MYTYIPESELNLLWISQSSCQICPNTMNEFLILPIPLAMYENLWFNGIDSRIRYHISVRETVEMKIILFTVVFIIEVYLSHQNGRNSGTKSQKIARSFHINEHLIRTGAHIGFFSILMFLALFLSNWLWVAVILWAIIDEATKPLLKNERYFSLIDVGWNMVGIMIGVVVWRLVALQ